MKLLKAIGGFALAILYFGIYFAWQFFVMSCAATAISFSQMTSMDVSHLIDSTGMINEEAYMVFMDSFIQNTLDTYMIFVGKYAIHMTALAGVFALLTYFIIFKIRKKSFFGEVGFRKIPVLDGFGLVIFGAFLNVFVTIVMSFIPFPEDWMSSYIEASSLIADTTSPVTIIYTVIGAPVIEEVIFRGLCHSSLKRGVPMLAAMIISSWGFGIAHGTIIWALYATLLGFLLVWMREKYNSLTASLLVHLGFNLMGIVLSFVGDMAMWLYILLGALSAVAVVAFIIYVVRTSRYKIELIMPSDGANKAAE